MEPSITDFGHDGIIDQVPENRMEPMIELPFHSIVQLWSSFLHISFLACLLLLLFLLFPEIICTKPMSQPGTGRSVVVL